ncbi:MAG: hypothetical protein KC933_34840 [Myxococcales bacterium]|nr:hypothetical protein [Myxococcales bacterium]MCB9647176.1 hypothetical protein [Deltaproteobacteria bacterium]
MNDDDTSATNSGDIRTQYGQSYYPPVPTRFTQALRTNLLWQFLRFLVINARMLRMVRKH